MRWLFAALAAVVGVLLFLPIDGNSTWGAAGVCGSGLGQIAQGISTTAASNCSATQVGVFVLVILLLIFLGLAALFQVKHVKRQRAYRQSPVAIQAVVPDQPSTPPAGWYSDPQHPGRERLWEGTRWTNEFRKAVGWTTPPTATA
jgi:hypothetical protein